MLQSSYVDGVLLAAGAGSRMGGRKLLRSWKEKSLISHTLCALGKTQYLASLTIVLGCDAPAIEKNLSDELLLAKENNAWNDSLPVNFVQNFDWKKGMSTSLQAGISYLTGDKGITNASGAMILLADQPLIQTKTIDLLANAYIQSQCSNNPCLATVPLFQKKRGNPVLLSNKLFPELMKLQGDIGARNIIKNLGSSLLEVPVDDIGVTHDVDTLNEYNKLLLLNI